MPKPHKSRVEELAQETIEHDLDPTTRRETFELDLEERGWSEDGEDIDLNDIEHERSDDGD